MLSDADLAGCWTGLDRRLACSALAAGLSAPGRGRRTWFAGGRIEPAAGVTAYVPGLPTWTAPIRVQHLLRAVEGRYAAELAGTVCSYGDAWRGWGAMTMRCRATGTAVAVPAATEDVPAVGAAARDLHARLM